MLSIPDMALLGAAALLLFGPEQLPRVARKAGLFMREVQNTSQGFIREMERAADLQDDQEAAKRAAAAAPYEPATYDHTPYEVEHYPDVPTAANGSYEPPAPEPPAPDPEPPARPRTANAEPPAAHETANAEPHGGSAQRTDGAV